MADVAFDAATSAAPATGTTRTWSHTCGAGADRLLLVHVEIASTNDWVTGVTYNGVAMTQIAHEGDFATMSTYLYALVAPATGANNVVVTSSNSVAIAGCSYSVANAKQMTTMDVMLLGNNSATTSRLWGPTTTTVDRALVVLFVWNSAEVPVAGANVTNRSVVNRQSSVVDRGGITTPAGDVYLTQTTTGATTWSSMSVGIAPVPAAGGVVPRAAVLARRRRSFA
jgi:hypothetical protein